MSKKSRKCRKNREKQRARGEQRRLAAERRRAEKPREEPLLGAGLPTPPSVSTEGLPAVGTGERAGGLRSDASAGSETRAEQETHAELEQRSAEEEIRAENERLGGEELRAHNYIAPEWLLLQGGGKGPRLPKFPSELDQEAFRLHSEKVTQEEIARRQGRSQPSVCRGIHLTKMWVGRTVGDAAESMNGFERLRAAITSQRLFLASLQAQAMEEYQRSRQTRKVKKSRTKTRVHEGGKADGTKITETTVEEYDQEQYGRVQLLNFAQKLEQQLMMIHTGHVSLGGQLVRCDEALDPNERDRWDRALKASRAETAKLKEELEEIRRMQAAERKAGSGVFGIPDQSPATAPQPKTPVPLAPLTQAVAPPSETVDVQSPAEGDMNYSEQAAAADQNAGGVNNATGVTETACDKKDSFGGESRAAARIVNNVNNEGERESVAPAATSGGRESLAAAVKEKGESGTLKTPDPGPPPEPAPQYRWEEKYRQEALDYHCLKFGLPPATTDMATGIPDPFKMSPRLWIERGYPYQIYIDRDIPCDRRNPLDTMGVIKLACHPVVNPEGW